MRLVCDHVRVRVPATSANLGPGFDCMGLALAHYDTIEVRALGSTDVRVSVTGEGAGELPDGEDHLVVRAIRAALDAVGASQVGLELTCDNRIPHGRGLGSSAAAVVAGILAVRMMINEPEALYNTAAFKIATQFEGHPDNAAPAILGGATISWTGPDGPHATQLPLHPDVVPVALVPQVRLATRTARGVLPGTVPHADAAFTAGRSALLVQALCHRPELLFDATAEKLHQEYRAPVMPSTWRLVRSLREAGLAAVVSGAGPSVLVLERASAGDESAAIRRQVLAETGEDWAVVAPGIAADGALAERL
ncbi:homoserine kinase [Actinotalea fermentans]|uniref:Homoserine kinase n=1 Tax=Actinotalea fermentans TaxID=43671 RepID=A0A511YT39_9CELL|nr:homoserine kinase [Actinotalea fermentans]KGM17610.1 serine kinase [Actinotalea fermentans ATCC 43279 = JCM 9966 = DSM 3133]GEN78364.1 homoserine kinase [Actinotalea fermentans]